MPGMKTGTIAKVAGFVKKNAYVNPARSFAAVTIDCPDSDNPQDKAPIHDVKCFARGPLDEIASLTAGQKVTITCKIGKEKLVDASGAEIKVKGFTFWYPTLVATKVEIEASLIRAEQKKEEKPAEKKDWNGETW